MKKTILVLILFIHAVFAEIIPADRRIDWNPGIPGGYPERDYEVDVYEFGAAGDGETDDSDAFIAAINDLPNQGGILYIPEGQFLITKSLWTDKGVLFKGEGFDKTRLLFDLGGSGDDCINFSQYDRGNFTNVIDGFTKGSTQITVENPEYFDIGDVLEIQQDNDPAKMYTESNWNQSWAQNARGQLIVVKAIDGQAITLEKPLYQDYYAEWNPVARTLGLVEYPGVRDLYIERLDAGDGHTISMRYVKHGLVENIESYNTFRTHVYFSDSYGCELRHSYLHHSHDYGGGGHGYGVDVISHTTDCLILDNIFEHLRHSMLNHVGACGNVYAYNYSPVREPQQLCDVSLHGHYGNYNLFESNIVEEINVADYWGPMGPGNTFLRNKITKERIVVKDYSHTQNFVGNNQEKSSTISIESSVENTLLHGNILRGKVKWDDSIADQTVPNSYFLNKKPDFFGELPWPVIGPDVDDDRKIPAQIRYENNQPLAVKNNTRTKEPTNFNLSIYPNPFNPNTTIEFELKKSSETRVDIFSITGQLVSTLVNKKMPVGVHQTELRLDDMPSGVYLVNMQTNAQKVTKKITYLK